MFGLIFPQQFCTWDYDFRPNCVLFQPIGWHLSLAINLAPPTTRPPPRLRSPVLGMSTIAAQRMPRLYSTRPSMRYHRVSIDTRNIHHDAILGSPSSGPSASASPIVHRATSPRPATAGNGSPATRPLRMIMFGKPGAVRLLHATPDALQHFPADCYIV
jgi:hypothetical protein